MADTEPKSPDKSDGSDPHSENKAYGSPEQALLTKERLRRKAAEEQCRRVEADCRSLRRSRKMLHGSYLFLIGLLCVLALILVPRLRRTSYLQGFSEGRSSVSEAAVDASPAETENIPQRTLPAAQESASAETEAPMTTSSIASSDPEPSDTVPYSDLYIGNKNSKKFHLPTCASLPAERNQVFFDSREEAINAGYSPCSLCNP